MRPDHVSQAVPFQEGVQGVRTVNNKTRNSLPSVYWTERARAMGAQLRVENGETCARNVSHNTTMMHCRHVKEGELGTDY